MTIGELAKEIHSVSKNHGWWDTERDLRETRAMIHCELSEALTSYRDGEEPVWYEKKDGEELMKPEGYVVELVDTIIRILDMCEHEGWNIEWGLQAACNQKSLDGAVAAYRNGYAYTEFEPDFPVFIDCAHTLVAGACIDNPDFETDMPDDWAGVIFYIVVHLYHIGVQDVEELILQKHTYNKSRPYRHGNKLC